MSRWYRTGTVTVVNGSKAVVGAGTNWLSLSGNAQVANAFRGPDGRVYEVDVVSSALALTLYEAYAGESASGASYAIVPTMGLTADLARGVTEFLALGISAPDLAADDGAERIGWDGATVADYLSSGPRVAAAQGVSSGVPDNLTPLNTAIAAAWRDLALPPGDIVVSAAPTNTFGVNIRPPGRLLKPVAGGYQQLSSESDLYQYVIGREYLAAWFTQLLSGGITNIVLSGDSTTAGVAASGDYLPHVILQNIARDRGIGQQVFINRGHSGAPSSSWDAEYAVSDVSAAAPVHLFIPRWGINDPYYGRTLAEYCASMRSGLTKIRALRSWDQSSILLMAPSSTSDSPNGRDEQWYERVVPALRAMAREFKCAFFDTYGWLRDSRGAAGVSMDDPYEDGRAVHPMNGMNAQIYSAVGDILYPTGLAPVRENRFHNLRGAERSPNVTDTPATYIRGIEISRAQAANGWPLDGGVLTVRQADGTYAMQWNWAYTGGDGTMRVRIGQAGTWLPWMSMGSKKAEVTLLNGWTSYNGAYAIECVREGDTVRVRGLVSGGSLTTETAICLLPDGFRPQFYEWFALPTNIAGETATVYVHPNGSVVLKSAPNNGYLSLAPISFSVQ
jgi:GDSL-like Lipase/Acylhydrolase family